MTATQTFRLYELSFQMLKDEAKAKEFVAQIEETVENKFESKQTVLATKEDVAAIKIQMAEMKTEIIRWVFGFFVAVALMMIGMYLTK
jgi:hypothetical protein